jgi:acetyltransferase-like isoleucine patch superfamily enzyme
MKRDSISARCISRWRGFWLWRAGYTSWGRMCSRLATLGLGAYKKQYPLAMMSVKGFIAPSAEIIDIHPRLGAHVFVGERVVIARWSGTGFIELQDRAQINRDCSLEIGTGGSITIGRQAGLQRGCVISAGLNPITIGTLAQIAPYCCFYTYDHGLEPDQSIFGQPVTSKGPIVVGDDAWLGAGVKVMSGVTIGRGAVVGAGSVVTRDIPDMAIAAGVPARVIRFRGEAPSDHRDEDLLGREAGRESIRG